MTLESWYTVVRVASHDPHSRSGPRHAGATFRSGM